VFSVLNAVVLRPLPFANQARVVVLNQSDAGRAKTAMSILDVDDFRARMKTVSDIAAIGEGNGTVRFGGKPHTVDGLNVMPQYFGILGMRPRIGRFLNAADSRPGVHSVVISDEFWRKYYAASPDALGRAVSFDGMVMQSGVSYTIVGVLPPGILLPDGRGSLQRFDYVAALPETTPERERGSRDLGAIALLQPGMSVPAATAESHAVAKTLQHLHPSDDATLDMSVQPLAADVVGPLASQLWTVFAAVIGILLIACANVANLIAARWSVRDREFALRRALGASSRRLAGQLLVETGVLAVLGGSVGVALAYGALHALGGTALAAMPRGNEVRLDSMALLYALFVVLATTLLAGMSPMATLAKSDLALVLKSAGRGGDASAGHRLRSVLVIVEVALALALIVVSSLVVRSFMSVTNTPLGIRPDNVSESGFYAFSDARFPSLESRALVQSDLLARLRALPGVDSAALAVTYPLGDVSLHFSLQIFGAKYAPGHEPEAGGDDVSPGYFATLGIPILRGRDFGAGDTMHSTPVAIVNQAFARTYLHGRDPIGARLRVPGWNGTKPAWATVVGVVGNERSSLTAPIDPRFYAPVAQAPPSFISAVIHRKGLGAREAASEMQAVFARVNPLFEAPEVYTVPERIAEATQNSRTAATLLGTLAIMALVLALSGIYGVVSFSVSQRSREFGVRLALGALNRDVLLDVLRQSLMVTVGGLALGLMVAALASLAIASQLTAISPFDPATFAAVIALLLVCSAVAAAIPAMRATRVDPAVALRYE
jgi:putative ABC transport system permease protein